MNDKRLRMQPCVDTFNEDKDWILEEYKDGKWEVIYKSDYEDVKEHWESLKEIYE